MSPSLSFPPLSLSSSLSLSSVFALNLLLSTTSAVYLTSLTLAVPVPTLQTAQLLLVPSLEAADFAH